MAAAARLPTLRLRHVVEGDGVHYAALARDVLAGDWSGVGNPYWSNLWPAAIAATRFVTRLDVVTAGRVASLVCGVALVLLVALLAERLFGRTTGLLAGLAAAGHPWLIHFSTLVFTESFFACLLVALLLAGWTVVESPSIPTAARAGLLGGLAVVTRPEAFAAVLVILAFVAARGREVRSAAVVTGAVAMPIVVFLAAHALVCRYYYDVWDLGVGSKGAANLLIGLATDDAAKERVTNEVTPAGENKLEVEMRESSLVGFTLAHPILVLTHTLRNTRLLAGSVWRVFPPVPLALGLSAFPRGAWPWGLALLGLGSLALAVFGLGAGVADRNTRRGAAYLAAVIALYLLGLAPLNVHDRLVVALAPLVLVFFGHGVAALAGRDETSRTLAAAVLVLTGLTSLYAVLRAPALAYGDDPPVQREVGLWIAAHAGPDTRVMTPSPAIAFYLFERGYEPSLKYNEVDLPWLGYEALVDYGRQRDVRVLAAPEWYLESARHPAAARLTDPRADHPGLRLLATIGSERPYRVHLYALEPVVKTQQRP